MHAQGVRDADELCAGWQRRAGEYAALAVRVALKPDVRVDAATTSDKPVDDFAARHDRQTQRTASFWLGDIALTCTVDHQSLTKATFSSDRTVQVIATRSITRAL